MKELNQNKDKSAVTPPETGVENLVFSVVAGKEFRLDLSGNGALAAMFIAGVTAACCICGGADAAVRLGITIVDKLLK